jgi:hypothetical protein
VIEYIAIGVIIAAAAGFAGWRAWQTVRVSRNKACGTGCGKCGSTEKP